VDKYYIIRADKRKRDRERRTGVPKKVRTRLGEVRVSIGKCKPSEKQCPDHEEHKAIEVEGRLICPHTYLVWASWVAFEDGNIEELIEQWEGSDIRDKLIRPYS
jgi:hypothetical protein